MTSVRLLCNTTRWKSKTLGASPTTGSPRVLFTQTEWSKNMPFDLACQEDFSNPFGADMFSYQAATYHAHQHWKCGLPDSVYDLAFLVICLLNKFKKVWIRLSENLVYNPARPDDAKAFTGGVVYMHSRSSYYRAMSILQDYGILIKNDAGEYSLDFSVRLSHLITRDAVKDSIRHRNPRGWGATDEGIETCARLLDEWNQQTGDISRSPEKLLNSKTNSSPDSEKQSVSENMCNDTPSSPSFTSTSSTTAADTTNSSCQAHHQPVIIKSRTLPNALKRLAHRIGYREIGANLLNSLMSHYSETVTTNNTFIQDKSWMKNVSWEAPERFYIMRSPADILAHAQRALTERSNRLQAKRKARGSITDLCNLFEEGWRTGQKERNASIMPARLVSRDRALLKSQIIGPAREAGIDVQDFAKWCALNWDGIGATFFHKAKSYPQQPTFAWFVRCLETYSNAYAQRDGLDLSGKANPSQRVTTQAVAAISERAEKAVSRASETVADLQAQLREAREELARVRKTKGLPIDDDPVYAKAIKLASRKITIGRYDDDDASAAPVRRKLTRRSK